LSPSASTQHLSRNKAISSARDIKILGLNVCGLMSKFNYGIIQSHVRWNKFDILCFSETKLDEADEANVREALDDYSPVYKHRVKYDRKSGGLATFFKNDIFQYCHEIKTKAECVQFFKIDKPVLGYEFILGNVYIPPDDSKYYKGDEFELLSEHLLDLGLTKELPVCLMGDFNARTGSLSDIVILDSYVADAAGLAQDEGAFFLNLDKLNELGVTTERINSDTKQNTNGLNLIELCKNTGVHIVNGRKGKDKTSGKLTCNNNDHEPVSTIDYAIASATLFPKLLEFQVDEFDSLVSDKHCSINLKLSALGTVSKADIAGSNSSKKRTHVPIPPSDNVHSARPNYKVKWNQDLSSMYQESFNIPAIEELDARLGNFDGSITREEMNKLAEEICNLFFAPGIEIGIVKPQGFKGQRANSSRPDFNKKKQPWFNAQCKNHRAMYQRARRLHKQSKLPEHSEQERAHAKMYKKTINSAIKEFNEMLKAKLRNLKSSNPKEYWEILNSGGKEKIGKIAVETFLEHFKTLNTVEEDTGNTDQSKMYDSTNSTQQDNSMLNYHFTEEEVGKVTAKLKSGKSSGIDQIVNEFLKNSPPQMFPLLVKYFNLILDSGIIPSDWKIGVIIPIYKKKGSIDDPDNYRGITLLSCIGKLFTALINQRLSVFLEANNLLGEEQAGFREGYSTLDHIFILNGVIEMYLGKKMRIYAAFVDYKKAFDSIDRTSLWSKLLLYGIEGKVFNVIQNLYNDAKSCLRVNNDISEYFSASRGVRQGENLSPLLFSIYLNDLENYIKEESGGVRIEATAEALHFYVNLYVLLYADDTIILSESPEDLQGSLDTLNEYCKIWKLEVNISKTKVVIFSRGKVKKNQTWNLGGQVIHTVDDYIYLGTTFNYNGRFVKAMQKQAAQAKRAMYGMIGKARKLGLPVDIQTHLFNALILPILLYGSEVWGFSKLDEIEKVQTSFYKQLLKLNGSTPNCTVHGEIGCAKISEAVDNRMLNFWSRLVLGKQSKIAFSVYKILRAKYESGEFKSKWIEKIHSTLNNIGMSNVWITDDPTNANWFKNIIKMKINDIGIQNWSAEVSGCGWCRCYKVMKSERKLEKYLTDLDSGGAVDLCRFRASNHKLPIVTGRFEKIKKEERLCILCDSHEIGDEFHYTFRCRYFDSERHALLKEKYWNSNDPAAGQHLFETQNVQELSNLAKFTAVIMNKFKDYKVNNKVH